MINIVIKPTKECNLNCAYCIKSNAKTNSISDETLINILVQVRNYLSESANARIKIYWHGGEPLLVGIDRFKNFLSMTSSILRNVSIENILISNLTLINEDWVIFLKDNNLKVVTSIDGPNELHDAIRIGKRNEPTLNKTLDGLKLILNGGVSFKGANLTLSAVNIKYPDEIYNFFSHKEIPFQIGTIIIHNKESNRYAINNAEYYEFMKVMYDKWVIDERDVRIITFEQIINNIFQKDNIKRSCASCKTLSFDPDGNVYACPAQDNFEELQLGNISKQELSKILSAEVRLKILKRAVENKCGKCKTIGTCQIGCALHSYLHHGDFEHPDPYCYARSKIYKYIINSMKSYI